MAQALQDIINQLQTQSYQPQVDLVAKQQAALPGEQAAAEAGLDAKKDQGFSDILNAARSRGTGVAFGGIPLADQSKYLATDYLPAQANLRSSYNNRAMSLQDAINQIYERRNTQAQSIYQFQQQQDLAQAQLAEQKRQFDVAQANARAAAAASAYNPSFGSSLSASANTPQYIGNNDYRGHLTYLAQKTGNADAAIALKYVGNDGKYYLDPYTTSPAVFQALDRIGAINVWKPTAAQAAPKAARAPAPGSAQSNTGIYGQKLNFGF